MPTVTIWHASWCAPCRGTLRDLVPTLEDEGIEPVTKDIDWCPCEAMDRDIDYLPTVTVDDGDEELMRCRGYPTADAGIIPARAGNRGRARTSAWRPRDHPRACGEQRRWT